MPVDAVPTLASVYRDYWLWWVPESIPGAVPYALIAIAGVWMARLGRFIHRVYY